MWQNFTCLIQTWECMNNCMFYKKSVARNPHLHLFGWAPFQGTDMTWMTAVITEPKILPAWAGVPGQGLGSGFRVYSPARHLWVALEADCQGRRKYLLSSSCCFLKSPLPSAPLIHTAWPQAGGLEHFLKNNGSVCLQSHDLFLLIKTNILFWYNTKKWGKWEGFENEALL